MREAIDALNAADQVGGLLECGLDRNALMLLMVLSEQGINPEALLTAMKELGSEADRLKSIKLQEQQALASSAPFHQ